MERPGVVPGHLRWTPRTSKCSCCKRVSGQWTPARAPQTSIMSPTARMSGPGAPTRILGTS
ncbi:hypothetical protein B0H17DRAFT_1058338 [Mycena rosella]|uniref:Uncharacterized protein n=1 Tax=Mycena rosella TaxID=1033263 RepID=A0AAD7DL33_MYCRO|nr:hypothetical protein B0H17DRAFT_1058338 [Mycena rosella]